MPGQPRAGREHLFGVTTIGERSYIEGEYAVNVRVRAGVGGKWTSGWRTEGSMLSSWADSSRGEEVDGVEGTSGGVLRFLRIGRGHGHVVGSGIVGKVVGVSKRTGGEACGSGCVVMGLQGGI